MKKKENDKWCFLLECKYSSDSKERLQKSYEIILPKINGKKKKGQKNNNTKKSFTKKNTA